MMIDEVVNYERKVTLHDNLTSNVTTQHSSQKTALILEGHDYLRKFMSRGYLNNLAIRLSKV